MGFFSNLFTKKNCNLKAVSNECPQDNRDSHTNNEDTFDYSKLDYDSEGWLTYPNGLKCRNVSQMFNDSFDDRLYDIIIDTKEKLGYNEDEAFYFKFNESGKRVFKYEDTFIVGIWELFTNKPLCFIRRDNHVMNQKEIDKIKRLAKKDWDYVIWRDKVERGIALFTDIWDGIKTHTIRQEFIEKVFEAKANNNVLAIEKFLFKFEGGLLSSCDYDGYDVMIFDIFTGTDIDDYWANSNKTYKSDEIMKALINLQAIYSTRISHEILLLLPKK